MPGPGKETRIIRRTHHTGEELLMPVATVRGSSPGPTFAITSGMHAGEYAGVLAAIRLIQEVRAEELSGTLTIVPVISTRAFMMRSMQISPVDEKEVHNLLPGNPGGTYSEMLIDVLYETVRDAQYLIDMHAGEFAQTLLPWVPVPWVGSADVRKRSLTLAESFDVQYVDIRTDPKTIPPFARFLAERGTANVWAEIGKNGLPEPQYVDMQYRGCVNALRAAGMLPGAPERFSHRYLGQTHTVVTAKQSGIWYPAVELGQTVRKGQRLGELRDWFGNVLERYEAPFDGLVLYYWSSPAINVERRPHGYDWHSGLVRLAGLPNDEPNVAL